MFIDAHIHLDKYSGAEIDGVVETIDREGILSLSVAVDAPSFVRTEEIAARSRLIVPGFGIHPSEVPRVDASLDDIEDHAARSPFIGEIGLDHRFITDTSQYGPQRDVFARFLSLAKEQDKFVNVHCVGAEYEAVEMMRAHRIERAIIHWYSGPPGALRQLIREGYMFSIGVAILHSDQIRDIARTIPTDQLLTETDSPGGPEWLTGDRGRPDMIADVVAELARVRRVHVDDLTETVRLNMEHLIDGDTHMAPWFDRLRV